MKKVLNILIVLFIILLAIVVAIFYRIKPQYSNKGIDKLNNENKTSAFENKGKKTNVFNGDEPLRILVLGVDKTATQETSEEKNGMRSDTIMLFSIFPKEDKVQLLSIPRDSFVKIHGWGLNKINASFNEFVYPDGGLKLTVQTVEDFLDVSIDHYAIVDYKAVSGIVDAVDGIDIEWELEDYTYTDDWVVPALEINLKKGTNHLDGEKAVSYLRARKAYEDQDIGRISAQQGFLLLLFDKLKSPATIFRIPKILDIIDEYVETDLNYGEISYLASYGLKLNKEDIHTETVEGYNKHYVPIGRDKVDAYIVDKDRAREIINNFPEEESSELED